MTCALLRPECGRLNRRCRKHARQHLKHESKSRSFGAAERQRISASLASVVGSPAAVEHGALGQRPASGARLQDLAVRNRAGCHIEHDRTIAARHCNRDRTGRHAGNARAVIGHQCRTGTHQHGGAAALGHPLGVAPDRAGMGRVADESEADAGLFRPLDRARGRLHYRDRSEAVTALDNESRGAIMHEARLRLGIDLTTL